MAEWIPTNDGHPLKTTDAMLEYIFKLGTIIATQNLELAMYRTIVPQGSDRPTNVPAGRTHRRAHALPQ